VEVAIPEVEALKTAVSALKAELAAAKARVAAIEEALAAVAPEMRALGMFDAAVTAPQPKTRKPRGPNKNPRVRKTTDTETAFDAITVNTPSRDVDGRPWA
jgi:hypothetical protein